MTKDNSEHWLELAKTLPKPQLEKAVAKVSPQAATPEKAKYISEDRLQLNMGVSEKTMQKLRRAQDLVSQKTRRMASLEDALEVLLETYLQKNDPIEIAKRNVKTEGTVAQAQALKSQPCPGHGKLRKPLPAQIKHQITLRDQGQCTHVEEGKRCDSQRWIEFHHQIPLHKGGSDNLNNLTTLCWAHHRLRH